ncbi:MAG: ATP synthase F1 subunit delta [Planctomycetota bacterium]
MKNVSQILARIYAEALIDAAQATVGLGRVVDDLKAVQALYTQDRDTWAFFSGPRIEPEVKKRVLRETLEGKISRPVMGLLHVLIDKRRGVLLDNVIAEFERYRDIRENRQHVHVTSAAPLPDEQREELTRRLVAVTGKNVELHEKIDPRVLGGLIVKVGDKVVDGTLKRRLEKLRRELVAVRS